MKRNLFAITLMMLCVAIFAQSQIHQIRAENRILFDSSTQLINNKILPHTQNNQYSEPIIFNNISFFPNVKTAIPENIDLEMKYIGTGYWEDPHFTMNEGEPFKMEDCNVWRSTLDPTIYALQGEVGTIFLQIINNSNVYVATYAATVPDGTVYISQLCKENGWDKSKYNNYGKLNGRTVTMPGDYFGFYETFGDGSWAYCRSSRQCKIILPDGFNSEEFNKSGVFLGLTCFNDKLITKSISLLSEKNKEDFISFINSREMSDATLLYYAVDSAIDEIASKEYPEDLKRAILITFTDGLDQGSLAKHPEYRNSSNYASHLAEKIKTTKIQGLPLETYCIGLISNDAKEDPELFELNLNSLASSANNKFLVNDVTELNERLSNIYDDLNIESYQKIIHFSVPMMQDGVKYRFTLDNASNAENSEIWYEGVFNIDNCSLENIEYHGFSCDNTSVIQTKLTGIKNEWDLLGCIDLNKKLLEVNKEDIDQWYFTQTTNTWSHNDESSKIAEVETQVKKSSAVIVFALDCSTSLGELFPLVKLTANSFIRKLAGEEAKTEIFEINNNDDSYYYNSKNTVSEWYNLQGIKVNNPSSGIYIVREGNIFKKIHIK